MAFDKTPSNWLSGYSTDTVNNTVTFNTADVDAPALPSFPELTDAEANPASGDIRKIVFAVIDALFKKFQSTSLVDRPSKLNITRGSTFNADDTITHTYTFTVVVAGSSFEVAEEP